MLFIEGFDGLGNKLVILLPVAQRAKTLGETWRDICRYLLVQESKTRRPAFWFTSRPLLWPEYASISVWGESVKGLNRGLLPSEYTRVYYSITVVLVKEAARQGVKLSSYYTRFSAGGGQSGGQIAVSYRVNPFRTAVPFWGQTTQISSSLSPKRDSGSKRVNTLFLV